MSELVPNIDNGLRDNSFMSPGVKLVKFNYRNHHGETKLRTVIIDAWSFALIPIQSGAINQVGF